MVRRRTSLSCLLDLRGSGSTAQLRLAEAPDPALVAIDPHTEADLLLFIQQIAPWIRFKTGQEDANEVGDWRKFCDPAAAFGVNNHDAIALTAQAIASFAAGEKETWEFSELQRRWLGRPHFALLLAFIRLQRHSRALLNEFTARHLDHYFNTKLGFTPRAAQPDRVTVSFELSNQAAGLLLPAGTLLRASADSQGLERFYSTATDLYVNHAQVRELRAVQVLRQTTNLESVKAIEPDASTALTNMLHLVYRNPGTKNSLPELKLQGITGQEYYNKVDEKKMTNDKVIDCRFITSFLPLLRFSWDEMRLELQEFKRLMYLYSQRSDSESEDEWRFINNILGVDRLSDSEKEKLDKGNLPKLSMMSFSEPRNFERSFYASIFGNKSMSIDWPAVPVAELNCIDDLYLQREIIDVTNYLENLLDSASCLMRGSASSESDSTSGDSISPASDATFNGKLLGFYQLMPIKLHIDNEWRQINWILQRCGQRRRQVMTWRLDPSQSGSNSSDFADNLDRALLIADNFISTEVKYNGDTGTGSEVNVNNVAKTNNDAKARAQAKAKGEVKVYYEAAAREFCAAFNQAMPWAPASDQGSDTRLAPEAVSTLETASTPEAVVKCLYELLSSLEDWFAMPAERLLQLALLVEILVPPTNKAPVPEKSAEQAAWNGIFEILTAAHLALQTRQRQHQFATCRGQCSAGANSYEAFDACLRLVISELDRKDSGLEDLGINANSPGQGTTFVGEDQEIYNQSKAMERWKSSKTRLAPYLGNGQLEQLDQFQALLLQPGSAPRRSSWNDIVSILESVQGAIVGWQPPPLGLVEWRQLQAHHQQVESEALAAGKTLEPCFAMAAESDAPPEPGPGFGLASRLLGLAEGKRSITLTLGLEASDFSIQSLLGSLPGARAKLKPADWPKATPELVGAHNYAGEVPNSFTTSGSGLNGALLVELSTAEGWLAVPIDQAILMDPRPAEDPSSYWKLTNTKPLDNAAKLAVLQFRLNLEPAAPALAPLATGELAKLRIRLRPWREITDKGTCWRSCGGFERLRLATAQLRVEVQELLGLRLQQDGTPLDPLQPFQPFGSSPVVGSSFYISHPEILDGDLEQLSFQGSWLMLPKDMNYNYNCNSSGAAIAPEFSAAACQAEVSLIHQNKPPIYEQSDVALFKTALDVVGNSDVKTNLSTDVDSDAEANADAKANADSKANAVAKAKASLQIDLNSLTPNKAMPISLAESDGEDLRLQQRVWRWRLTPTDFGHGRYPSLVAQKAQQLALAISKKAAFEAFLMIEATRNDTINLSTPVSSMSTAAAIKPPAAANPDMVLQKYNSATGGSTSRRSEIVNIDYSDYTVPEPYTPLLEKLQVSYSRCQNLSSINSALGQLMHIHPFGEVPFWLGQNPQKIIDRSAAVGPINSTSSSGHLAPLLLPSYPNPGELYIGLEGVQPPQPITLAFQLAEGSARGERPQPAVNWQVLDGAEWLPLQVREDGTDGLLHSGILRFDLPMVAAGCQLPPERLWLRASLLGPLRAYATILAIQTQAVEAVFLPQDHGPDHYLRPLPPHSIEALVEANGQIASIRQPFNSCGGLAAEAETELRMRVAEQLRHKGRALASWDYERLLWDKFSNQLHRVICLPAQGSERVEVLVIPNLRQQQNGNLFSPGAPVDLLELMEAYLRERCPPEIDISVRNPIYFHVKVRLWVCLQDGVDRAYAEQQLQQELIGLLSPWADNADGDMSIGGMVFVTDIAAAIESLSYVDYLENIKLYLLNDGGRPLVVSDTSLLAPQGDSVLISYSSHDIEFVSPHATLTDSSIGINMMKIGLDFQIA
jgi:hypothetical protein